MKHFPLMRTALAISMLALAAATTGCVAYRPLQFQPVRKATPIAPRFTQSYYYIDRDKNLYFVMRSSNTDQATGTPIDQIATIRVFWHPKGGVTSLHPTALNATFRYVVMTPTSVGMYEGAGFVRLNSKDGARKFEARVIDGDMRLTQASSTFKDTLGRAHIKGYFSAIYDDATAVDMLLNAHREFFARSLVSKPADPASTAPAPATDATQNWGMPSPMPGPMTLPSLLDPPTTTPTAPTTIPATPPASTSPAPAP